VADTVEYAQAQPWLGTLVEIRAQARTPAILPHAIAAAFAAVARVHRALSGHDERSELTRINREAANAPQPISSDLRAVLACALDIAASSGGCFDPTVGAQVTAMGFLPRHQTLAAPATWRDIELSTHGVRYARPLIVDLGGIAKGYAVDCAVAALRAHGASAGRVNAGGDLRLYGDAFEPIHVRTAGAQRLVVPLLAIADGAVATSAFGDRRRRSGRRWTTPLVDPRSSLPVMATRTVSVIAATCMLADALTKVVALRGREALAVLRRYDAAAAVLSPAAGRWRCTLLDHGPPQSLSLRPVTGSPTHSAVRPETHVAHP
jgi:FAD:protein FMN transferase